MKDLDVTALCERLAEVPLTAPLPGLGGLRTVGRNALAELVDGRGRTKGLRAWKNAGGRKDCTLPMPAALAF